MWGIVKYVTQCECVFFIFGGWRRAPVPPGEERERAWELQLFTCFDPSLSQTCLDRRKGMRFVAHMDDMSNLRNDNYHPLWGL